MGAQSAMPPLRSVPSMIQKLPKLSQGQPESLWQVAIKAQETDFIRFLSSDRILVGFPRRNACPVLEEEVDRLVEGDGR